MPATTIPTIPPRPARSHNRLSPSAAAGDSSKSPSKSSSKLGNRLLDRSQSPSSRDSFAPSPLNDIPGGYSGPSLYSQSRNASSSSLPQRPPSVTLPSIGQEGNEYANIFNAGDAEPTENPRASPTQARNIDNDLPLYAPKASLPNSSAKARVAAVTRTDSSQAAAAGIGKAHSAYSETDSRPMSLKSKASNTSLGSSAPTERPSSTQPSEGDHGIPEIGQRVPMYPDAGDVQAPSPSPYSSVFPSGIGFHNDGSQRPRHQRTRSGREVFSGPPGSYGLHGHGAPALSDKFEKAWYERHPEALAREEKGEYGPGLGAKRAQWALSSDDLNKLVRDTTRSGSGFGTAPVDGTPEEHVGYIASEEYAARIASRPPSAMQHKKTPSNSSHADSPSRKTSFPVEGTAKEDLSETKAIQSQRPRSEHALDSEAEDDNIIHVDPPSRHESRMGRGYGSSTEDLGLRGRSGGNEVEWSDEVHGAPILASDEVARRSSSDWLQPAVSPPQSRRGSGFVTGADSEPTSLSQAGAGRSGSRGSSVSGSRPTSRPRTGHARFASQDDREEGRSLENVVEYEPLFPEDDKAQRPLTAADRLSRPELRKKFPSQDIWEDAPNSLQLQATVSTPELPNDEADSEQQDTSKTFEHPDKEASRKGEVSEEDRKSFLHGTPPYFNKSHIMPHLRDEMPHRPGIKQRFPSRDIWEDSPDSLQLQTTVSTPPNEDTKSPQDVRPTVGAVAAPQEQAAHGKESEEGEGRTTMGTSATPNKPSIPARPNVSKTANGPNSAQGTVPPSIPSLPARPTQRVRELAPADIPPLSTKPSESTAHGTTRPGFLPPGKDLEGRVEPPSSPATDRKVPTIPDRPKPQIPARPSKPISRESAEHVPLSKSISAGSAGSASSDTAPLHKVVSPPVTKPKPSLPSRPNGGKIAALKAGFLSDLDKRLQLGPQAPKPHEKEDAKDEEKERAPLSDARKGRARGPARRKPAAPSEAVEETKARPAGALEISLPRTIWRISSDGTVDVESSSATSAELDTAEEPASVLGTNTAGEALSKPEDIDTAAKVAHRSEPSEDAHREQEEQQDRSNLINRISNQSEATETVPKPSEDPPITGQAAGPQVSLERGAADEKEEDPAFTATKTANVVDTERPSPQAKFAAAETASPTTHVKPEMTSSAIQTGERVIVTSIGNSADGAQDATTGLEGGQEKVTAYLGANSRDDEDVVVKGDGADVDRAVRESHGLAGGVNEEGLEDSE
ncbi:MAG: hypothetical protein M1819_003938 [Sarea resinae]|nr:MAG: hypothetical protein M1819_003938 [Sarea resinae]